MPVKLRIVIVGAVIVAALLLCGAPAAQPNCDSVDRIRRHLLEQFRESPVGRGLNSRGLTVEVFASPGGRTWSIVVVGPDGWGCLVEEGENWRPVRAAPVGEEG